MRTLYLLLLLSVITTNALAANITQVTFASSTPTVTNIQIANLGSIKSIYTAGVYAWATDGVNAAFYDGKQWQPGTSLTGVSAINGIYPAYPVTGATSEAWANVTTGNGPGVAYFDGTNWHAPELIADILGIQQSSITQASITTSGGAVFILATSLSNHNTTYYTIKAPASSTWNQPQTIPGMYIFNLYDAFDDNNPTLNFMALDLASETGISYLYRLALTGPNAGLLNQTLFQNPLVHTYLY